MAFSFYVGYVEFSFYVRLSDWKMILADT